MLLRFLAVPLIALLAFVALGGAVSAVAGPPPLRGQMIDVGGGRRMHLICEGPPGAGPTIVFEAGAFGFSADWGATQQMATQRGWRSCSYDRAGMGLSDPGPAPRDAMTVTADLKGLLERAGEKGPYILVGHSMAGLYLPLFARRYPADVAGLVLVDASTRQTTETTAQESFVSGFTRASRWAAVGASLGLFKPVAWRYGDRIGLPPAAKAEKSHAFASGAHNRAAYEEVRTWPIAARQMREAGPLDPTLPVSVITAGPITPEREGRKAMQAAPAQRSARGYYRNVERADHRTLLGLDHGAAIIEGIARIRQAP
jgi:pimeloyl-ACP methyl ester carboxylesterase